MKKFLVYTLAGVGVLFLVLVTLLVIGIRSLFSQKPLSIQPDTQLYIYLNHDVHNFPRMTPFVFGSLHKPTVWEIDRGLRMAAQDDKITSALVHIDAARLSLDQSYTLAQAIKAFRQTGKKIQCYASSFGTLGGGMPTYLIAAHCDSITVQRLGEVAISHLTEWDVLGRELVFMRSFLDKWKIKTDFLVKGAYKKAPETFTHQGFTPENRQMWESLVSSMQGDVITVLSGTRFKKAAVVSGILDRGPYLDTQALKAGVIDAISNDIPRHDRSVTVESYVGAREHGIRNPGKSTIAVVPLEGAIIDDGIAHSMREKLIKPKAVKAMMDELAGRSDIAAIVVSINSPGGSALASEKIWSILKKAKSKKPMIVSMQRSAASGGYYIAAAADKIVATPFTLTGSIGVYVGKFVIGDMLRELGLNPDPLDVSSESSMLSMFQPFSDRQRAYIQQSLDHTYARFVEVVADGRQLPTDKIRAIAEGRVWTGAQGSKNGLVDQQGGLSTALELAASAANHQLSDLNVELIGTGGNVGELFKEALEQFDASMDMMMKSLNHVVRMINGGGVQVTAERSQ